MAGLGKLAAVLRSSVKGLDEILERWLTLPIGYVSVLTISLGIVVATFDVPRRVPVRALIWPFIGGVMLTAGLDSALAHAHRCFPRFRFLLRAASATLSVIIIVEFATSNHAAGIVFIMYGMRSIAELWKTRRRRSSTS